MTRRARMVWMLLLAAAAIGAGVAFNLARHTPDDSSDTVAATRLLLTQTYPDASGKPLALADFRGHKLVINFWATWCAPCVEEIPEFSRVYEAFQSQGVRFLGVGIDSEENIAAFSKKIGSSYPLIATGASGTELARRFGNRAGGLPFTILVNEKGQLLHSHIGRLQEADLRAWLTP